MTYRGRVRNGQIVLDEPGPLPEGARVNVEVLESSKEKPAIWSELLKLAGTAEGLPADMAEQHDHYLYGTAKKK